MLLCYSTVTLAAGSYRVVPEGVAVSAPLPKDLQAESRTPTAPHMQLLHLAAFLVLLQLGRVSRCRTL